MSSGKMYKDTMRASAVVVIGMGVSELPNHNIWAFLFILTGFLMFLVPAICYKYNIKLYNGVEKQ